MCKLPVTDAIREQQQWPMLPISVGLNKDHKVKKNICKLTQRVPHQTR